MADEPRDYNREAAHERYERAADIAKETDTDFNDAYNQLRWNTEWEPGDPTYQEVQENWDYYTQATQGGTIPTYQVPRREFVENQKTPDQDSNLIQLQSNLKDRQQRDVSQARQVASDQLYAQYATMGINPYNDPLYNQSLDAIQSMDEVPGTIADANRRFRESDGSVKKNPLDWNFFGVNSQTNTPDEERAIYDYLFEQQDSNGGPQVNIFKSPWRNKYANDSGYVDSSESSLYPKSVNPHAENIEPTHRQNTFDPDIIDDGQSVVSRESPFMTGSQYRKYVEAGLPGRPLDQIYDDEIYNKQDETEAYGFVPYITNEESLAKFHDQTAPHTVSNIFNHVANARRDLTDHSITYEGETYSGDDFNKQAQLWLDRVGRIGNNRHPVITENPGEYDIPQALVMYDSDDPTKRYVAPNDPISVQQGEDGSIIVKFDDDPRHDWVFADKRDMEDTSGYETAKDDDVVLQWVTNWEPLTLSDGRTIRADKVFDIIENMDDYANYDVGLGPITLPNMAKQNNLKSILEDPSDFLPWITDMALSSSPYITPGVNRFAPWIKAAADSGGTLQGFRPGYRDYVRNDGGYDLISENPKLQEIEAMLVGNAAMPYTERLWGPLGRSLFKTSPTKWAVEHVAPFKGTSKALDTIPGRAVVGASDEGIEEIAGNIVEGLIQDGPNWYSDKAKDELGRTVYDSQNNPVYLPTDAVGRIGNYKDDALDAYVGGAMLSGIIGWPGVIQERNDERRQELLERAVANATRGLESTRDFTDEELRGYRRS